MPYHSKKKYKSTSKSARAGIIFTPARADKTLKAYTATANTILEFAVFGTDQ